MKKIMKMIKRHFFMLLIFCVLFAGSFLVFSVIKSQHYTIKKYREITISYEEMCELQNKRIKNYKKTILVLEDANIRTEIEVDFWKNRYIELHRRSLKQKNEKSKRVEY